MSLYAKAEGVPLGTMDMGNTAFSTKIIYGMHSSLMIAERPGGYHSKPHTHDCEQLNYLQSGQLHVFTEDAAYVLEVGDVLRIKPNVVHWSWNKAEEPCVLIEVHSPGMQDDPTLASFAVGLFAEDEDPSVSGSPTNKFVHPSSVDVERIESLPPSES